MVQTRVGLEGDVGGIHECLHHLRRLAAKGEGHQGIGNSVTLEDRHVLVSTVGRRLTTEEIRVNPVRF